MTSRSLSVRVMGWMCACGLAALAAPASAQDCMTDADCDPGFVCTSYGTVDCGFACPEGEKCPDMPPDCAPMEIKGCSPAPCTADANCPSDMVCFSQTYMECSGGGAEGVPAEDGSGGSAGSGAAGAGGAAGSGAEPPPPEPAPEDCKEVTQSMCAPKYVPPCKADADCGAGFTCEEYESCGCSASAGSAGDPGADPAPPPEPTEPDCTCEKTGEFYCQLVETACASVDECPDGFSCEANPESVVCSEPTMTEPAGTGGAAGGADGGAAGSGASDTPEDSCGMTTEPEKVCMPPYWNTGFGGGGRGVAELGSAADGNAMATGAGGPTGAEPPTASGSDETAKSSSGDGGGFCSVAIVGNADSRNRAALASLATALALIALAVRRRRRAA